MTHPTIAGYCLWVILVLAMIALLNKCVPLTEASDRARSGGSEARIVEDWPWE